MTKRQALPVDGAMPAVIEALRSSRAAVVIAPPGSGKTTRVPPGLLDSGVAGAGKVLVVQPRRVAARLAARRIASERGVAVGQEVGYRTRFDTRAGPNTKLEILTEGLLVRWLQRDPFLDGVACVVLDEFHERSLQLDLALALLRDVQRSAREDLRVVVMSATLDPAPVVRFLGGAEACPVIEASGRTFDVDVRYDPRASRSPLPPRVAAAVRRALSETADHATPGHVLAFLPGVAEIERTGRELRRGERALASDIDVFALHGRLPAAEQDRALAPSSRRKVVLATNLAETSVTLEGVVAVVDSGLARVARFDTGIGVTRLETKSISRASADQRAGRAGRTRPGIALRLWTRQRQCSLAEASAPEVRRADLAPVFAELLAWGADPRTFSWFEAPPTGALDRAERLLRELSAIDESGLTPQGRLLASLPVHPRLGAVVLAGRRAGLLATAATAAALAESPDPIRGGGVEPDEDGDLGVRLRAVAELEATGRAPRGADRRALEEVRRVRNQLVRAVDRGPRPDPTKSGASDPTDLAGVLLVGFGDRVGQRREGAVDRYRLASGLGARLDDRSAARGSELLLALGLGASAKGEYGEARIRLAIPLEPSQLPSVEETELEFDPEREAVVHRRVRRFGALVLGVRPADGPADPWKQAEVLAAAAAADLDRALTLTSEAEQLGARLALLAAHCPELGLPDLSDRAALLPQLCVGRRSFAQLRSVDLAAELRARLDGRARAALAEHAPERVRLPSGSTVRLRYDPDPSQPPVLAARIQQLFGRTTAPRVARGRVGVLLELLAPNGRPQQVTADLAGFWSNTYPEIRKELRGRYAKHSWPEDPLTAEPQDRPSRRRPRE